MPKKRRFTWWSDQITPFKKVWLSGAALLMIILFGITGFTIIEGWPIPDAFYFTIITLSTVGFGEIRPLSEFGRMFTAFLIILGIGTVGYGFGNLAAFFIEGELHEIYRSRRMEKIIDRMRDHIIICGFGNEGRHAGEELNRHRVPFIVIEKDSEVAQRLRDQDMLVIHGDATEDDVLVSAGLRDAKGLIATVPEDSDNLFIALTARGLNPDLMVVARAVEESTIAKLYRAGANKVISSREIGGRRMASVLIRPKVLNFLDVMMHDEKLALRLEEVDVGEKSPFAGKSIRDLRIRERTGAMIIACQSLDQSVKVNPPAEQILHSGDVLIVLGNEAQVQKLTELANV